MAAAQVRAEDDIPPPAVAVVGYQPPGVKFHDSNNETVRRLLANDPEIAGLNVYAFQVRTVEDSNTIGRAIRNSTHLRRIEIRGELEDENGFQVFLEWLAHHRSIETIKIWPFDLTQVDIFQILAPFIEHNTSLRCIDLMNRESSLILTLSNPGRRSGLEKINLSRNNMGDTKAAEIINALNKMPMLLHNLLELDLRENEIGKEGCVALCALMKNSECRIQRLDLRYNSLDIECMATLISGLATNTSIKSLDLWSSPVPTAIGWQMLCIFLSSHRCSLEKMEISGNIEDGSASFLGDSLTVNMKTLSIIHNDFTPAGWRDFSQGVKASTSILRELILEECAIDDAGAIELFQALVHNTTLTKFSLSYNDLMTSDGWIECLQLLIGSQTALEEIRFVLNQIDDEGAGILVNLLWEQWSTVKHLDVQCNTAVTTNGWRAFTAVLLPSSRSKLKTLRVGDEYYDRIVPQINDEVIMHFAAALASNNYLSVFDIGHVETVSPRSLGALMIALCDKTNISSVCDSNHTLNTFDFTSNDDADYGYPWSRALVALLKVNRQVDKAVVVRQKLLMSSVLDKDVSTVFGPMPVSFFPSIIEWIGRDRLGYSAMYCLLQNVPSILEHRCELHASVVASLESPRKLRK